VESREAEATVRVAPNCPCWPNVFSVRTVVTVGSNGRIAVGGQRLRIACASDRKVVHCQHANGNITVLREAPAHGKGLMELLHCPAGRSSAGLNDHHVRRTMAATKLLSWC